jgi:hypothetical protein
MTGKQPKGWWMGGRFLYRLAILIFLAGIAGNQLADAEVHSVAIWIFILPSITLGIIGALFYDHTNPD